MLCVFNDLRRGVGVKHRNLRSVIFEIERRLRVRVPVGLRGYPLRIAQKREV
jgi:hypothetical protein